MEGNMSLDNLDVKKIGKNTYEVTDPSTGEILGGDDVRLNIAINNQKKKDSVNKAKKKGIRKVQGKTNLVETHNTNWKPKSHFIKIYRSEMRDYKKIIKLSSNAGLILLYLQDYIEFGTNKIIMGNDSSFSNIDISELTGLSVRIVSESIKELEEKLFIKRLGSTHNREIYLNPYLLCSGNIIEYKTVDLFDGYKPLNPY